MANSITVTDSGQTRDSENVNDIVVDRGGAKTTRSLTPQEHREAISLSELQMNRLDIEIRIAQSTDQPTATLVNELETESIKHTELRAALSLLP